MSITEYANMLAITERYNNRENMVYSYLKDIISVSTKMHYTSVLEKVCQILEECGEVRTARIDDKKISYIVLTPSYEIKEKIINLKHQVYDQQERDFSEKILSL